MFFLGPATHPPHSTLNKWAPETGRKAAVPRIMLTLVAGFIFDYQRRMKVNNPVMPSFQKPVQTFTIHQSTLRSDMMGFSDFLEIHGLLSANEGCDFYGIMGCFDVPMPIFTIFGMRLILIDGSLSLCLVC